MYPYKLQNIPPRLRQLAESIILEMGSPSEGLPLGFRAALGRYMRIVNSYYTNGMEGNPTRIKDIERALSGELAENLEHRNGQLEHLAHLEVEESLHDLFTSSVNFDPTEPAFLCQLHERFYSLLPEELRFGQTHAKDRVPITPGQIRKVPVTIGRHVPPATESEIRHWLNEFHRCFSIDSKIPSVENLIATAIAHHRFLWIHPFADGNGRVVRLFTNAYFWRIGIKGAGQFWAVSRGFARQRARYDAALAQADLPPRNSYDGRGPLSEEETVAFCQYFFEVTLDQIRFMAHAIQPTRLHHRIESWLQLKVQESILSKGAAKVLRILTTSSSLTMDDIQSHLSIRERAARNIASELLNHGFVTRAHHKAPLSLVITADMAETVLPALA